MRGFALEALCSTPRIGGSRVGTARVLRGLSPEAADAIAALGTRRGLSLRTGTDEAHVEIKRTIALVVMVVAGLAVGVTLLRPQWVLGLFLPPDDLARRIEYWRLSGSFLPIIYAGADKLVATVLVGGFLLAWLAWTWWRDLCRRPLLEESLERLPRMMQPRDWLVPLAPVLRETRPTPRRGEVAELIIGYDDLQQHLGAQLDHAARQLVERVVLLAQAAAEIEASLTPEPLRRFEEREQEANSRLARAGSDGPNFLLRQALAAAEAGRAALQRADQLLRHADADISRARDVMRKIGERPTADLSNPDEATVAEVERAHAGCEETVGHGRGLLSQLAGAGIVADRGAPANLPAAEPARYEAEDDAPNWGDRIWFFGKLGGAALAAIGGGLYLVQAYASWTGAPTAAQAREANIDYAVHQVSTVLRARVSTLGTGAKAVREIWSKDGMRAEQLARLDKLESSYRRQVTELKDYLYMMEDAGTFRLIFQPGDPMFEQLVGLQKFLIAEEQVERPVSFSKAMVLDKMSALDANLDVLSRCLFVIVKFEPPLVRAQLNECVQTSRAEMQAWP